MVKIGIADGFCAKNKIDRLKALENYINKDIEVFQIFLDNEIILDKNSQKEINKISRRKKLDIIFHAPTTLTSINNYEIITSTIKTISPKKFNNILIFHQKKHENQCTQFWEIVKFFNKEQIIPYIENYNIGIETDMIKDFLFTFRIGGYHKIGAVIDIPRFFNREENLSNALQELSKVMRVIFDLKDDIILHLIDTKYVNQDNRMWCPFGEGRIPYTKIFGIIKESNFFHRIRYIIFEYETVSESLKSIYNLKNLLYYYDL